VPKKVEQINDYLFIDTYKSKFFSHSDNYLLKIEQNAPSKLDDHPKYWGVRHVNLTYRAQYWGVSRPS